MESTDVRALLGMAMKAMLGYGKQGGAKSLFNGDYNGEIPANGVLVIS